MKRYILILCTAIVSSLSALGMNFKDAQAQAYFLSDKMAYELNLSPQQYDQVYQVNLEYFLNVSSPHDIDGVWWSYRNADLGYILYDWQWRLYRAADYFFRPLSWIRGAWHCSIWNRYHRDYYFYRRPAIYAHYHGGLWHGRHHHSPSPFIGHRPPKHHGGMNANFGKPGKPGHKPGHNHHRPGGNDGYRPGNNHRPGGNDGYRPGNNHRPGGNDGYRPGNNNRPGGNDGYRPGNNNRPGGNDGYRPGNNNRPGGNDGYRPGSNGKPGGNDGYRPGNNGNSRPSGGRGGNSMGNSRSTRNQSDKASSNSRSFNGGRDRR